MGHERCLKHQVSVQFLFRKLVRGRENDCIEIKGKKQPKRSERFMITKRVKKKRSLLMKSIRTGKEFRMASNFV